MQKIIEYLNNNPTYVIVFAATLLACVAAVVVICLFYKHAKNKDELAIADAEQSDFTDLQEEDEDDDLPEMQYTSLTVLQDNNEDETFDPSQVLNDSKEQLTEESALNANEQSADGENNNNILANDHSESTQDNRPELNTRYSGKWLIIQEENRYSALLKASNGETMLSTESYTSLSGIKSGIDTLKKNIEKENYAINLDKNGNFVFKIFSTSNRLLCIGEGYSTREQCEKAFQSVKRFSKTAIIVKPENATDNK